MYIYLPSAKNWLLEKQRFVEGQRSNKNGKIYRFRAKSVLFRAVVITFFCLRLVKVFYLPQFPPIYVVTSQCFYCFWSCGAALILLLWTSPRNYCYLARVFFSSFLFVFLVLILIFLLISLSGWLLFTFHSFFLHSGLFIPYLNMYLGFGSNWWSEIKNVLHRKVLIEVHKSCIFIFLWNSESTDCWHID